MSSFDRKNLLRPLALVGALAGSLMAVSAVQAQTVWTTVGSTGVVDDNDFGIVEFVQNEARTRATAPAGSELNLRYNITQMPGYVGAGSYAMRVRFRDGGADAQVRLDLRRALNTGPTSTLASFDSNAFGANVGYQTQQQCISLTWDYPNAGYWIEATLRKTADTGAPGLALIQLIPVGGPCNG